MCLAVLVVTNIIYIIWAQGEQLWWDDVKTHGYPAGWKHGPLTMREVDAEDTKKEVEDQKDKH